VTVGSTLIQSGLAVLIAGVPTSIGGWFAFRQATKVQRSADRANLTDDLQDEVAALRAAVAEARKECDQLRYRLRGAMEYLDVCMAVMRRADLNPPQPSITVYPWEGDIK
jgi:hypothetical protein